jgi:V8-like Glu-specific endopeptidase
MESWTEADRARLADALRTYDRRQVTASVDRFTEVARFRGGSPALLGEALWVLKQLHGKRYVGLVQSLAESLLRNGLDDPDVRHRYALALLDDDRLAAAEAVLRRLPPRVIQNDPEVRGAIGRVHKVRYLTGRSEGDLGEAVSWYRSTYDRDPVAHHYHGINAAAMLLRAERDGVRVPGYATPRGEAESMAAAILDRITVMPEPRQWHLATAAEASLVLGRHDETLAWVTRYVVDTAADAFEINTTLRQFERVHGLVDDVDPGRRVLPLLRSRLLQSAGGRVVLQGAAAGDESLRRLEAVRDTPADPGLERRFSDEQFRSINWLRAALSSCRAVARIETRLGDGVGTGFLLDGRAIAAGLPDRILLTNAHVIPDTVQPIDGCYVTFRGNDGATSREVYPIRRTVWSSPVQELDATVVELRGGPDASIEPLPLRRAALSGAAGRRAYVIGYPNGVQDVCFSLHDTRVLDLDDRVAHYRSPTEDGSSGSPVFDDEWRVFALHHRGGHNLLRLNGLPGTYEANEGIRLDRISAALRAEFGPPAL